MNALDALCDPSGPYGSCCSQYGWCGSSPAHCEVSQGCQSGCTDSLFPGEQGSFTSSHPPSINLMAYIASAATASTSAAASSEPVLGPPPASTASTVPQPTGPVTTDGTCGAAHGGTVCGNWYRGSCCSQYGFCGNTSAHCGAGCQSGPCDSAPVVPAPGPSQAPLAPAPGSFNVVGQSGVPPMHAALLENGRVVFLDKVENYTQLQLSDGQYAYSAEYDPASNMVVALAYKTNAFCSGGHFLANGTLVSLGGNAPLPEIDPTVGDGFTAIRYLTRSSIDADLDGQPWMEPGNKLSSARWYPSAQILQDGTIFVASGSLNGLDLTVAANNNPTYEILDINGISYGNSISMDILARHQPYFMYPFLHLLRDGSLFVFVSKSAETFNVTTNSTITSFPDLPGMYRTYPNTGTSGGGQYQDITSPTDPSCGRIQPLSQNANWEMDSMPEGRGMVEGTMLPDGTVIFLNGCNEGAQGFGLAQDPTLEALIYDPTQPLGERWSNAANTTIARLYHSVALLLLDGTVMVAGSNPVQMPILQPSAQNPYVTEFRVEIYTPPYLSGDNANNRPTGVTISTTALHADNSTFTINFDVPAGAQSVQVALYTNGFVTHSLHMGQRLAYLDSTGWAAGATAQTVIATMPPSPEVVPPGPYVVYVVVDGIPAIGQFVLVS
ncbi:MAG: hypothetical protein M1821_005269 [Bathelium mastoideum]|nr:MAG: hypothetical protein M1821_005269 [Bathelium mastoideum]